MPKVTPQYGPEMPFRVGALYNGGYQNGILVYTQPGGVGSPVVPQPPAVNPPPSWKNSNWLPAFPYCYQGLLTWGCKHLTNTCETYRVYDNYAKMSAALLCCPVCSYIGYIIEPYEDWDREWYSIYPVGIVQPAYNNAPLLG